MIEDDPHSVGTYAHTWHRNLAMTCYEAMHAEYSVVGDMIHNDMHRVANDAASRFMKLCFDVDTSI